MNENRREFIKKEPVVRRRCLSGLNQCFFTGNGGYALSGKPA